MSTESRIADLEMRLTYQEAEIESLTRADLAQQCSIERLQEQIGQLRARLLELDSGAAGIPGDDPPPPHY